jgi:hypothetical protein
MRNIAPVDGNAASIIFGVPPDDNNSMLLV